MKSKKHRKKDINRNSGIYFVSGLVLVLLLTYIALEWKTYEQNKEWDVSIQMAKNIIDEPDIVIRKKKEVRKKIKPPAEIKIEEDDEEIEETLIESTETDADTEVVPIDSIAVMDDEPIDDEIPFFAIEEVPVFPGCEDAEDKRRCFEEMIIKHVKKNFQYPEIAQEMGLEGRVDVLFIVDKKGHVVDLKMRGPHQILEDEAARIISKLPQMEAGKQRGTPVRVPFTMPIVFKLY